jgi:hypothetical protein
VILYLIGGPGNFGSKLPFCGQKLPRKNANFHFHTGPEGPKHTAHRRLVLELS